MSCTPTCWQPGYQVYKKLRGKMPAKLMRYAGGHEWKSSVSAKRIWNRQMVMKMSKITPEVARFIVPDSTVDLREMS